MAEDSTTGTFENVFEGSHMQYDGLNKPKRPEDQVEINEGVGKVWARSQTRVFDVFFNDSSSATEPDIFAYESKNKVTDDDKDAEDDNDGDKSGHEPTLINTGQGRCVHLPAAGSGFVSKRSGVKQLRNLSLPLGGAPRETPPSTGARNEFDRRYSTSSTTENSSETGYGISNSLPTPLSTANQGDKWPPQVESAFLLALRAIMKNGTSKIKLREKNYGRNELISLYIKHTCGEYRTKKQISSHIQVWKKSILNKISNNIETNDFEKELLTLIEQGASQTDESLQLFEDTFNEILDAEESNTEVTLSSGRSTPVMTSTFLAHSPTVNPTASSHSSVLGSLGFKKEPSTPLEYAQELYSHLKSYKCVPVNTDGPMYSPSTSVPNASRSAMSALSSSETSREDSQNKIIEAAKEVESQQRRLIEELFQQKSTVKAPCTSPGTATSSHVQTPQGATFSSNGKALNTYYNSQAPQQRFTQSATQNPPYSGWLPRVPTSGSANFKPQNPYGFRQPQTVQQRLQPSPLNNPYFQHKDPLQQRDLSKAAQCRTQYVQQPIQSLQNASNTLSAQNSQHLHMNIHQHDAEQDELHETHQGQGQET
ncbi:HBL187Wp [Eremothecium sinecaudum]|uniref:HBL187Wp n=1 Tax=Eremothecium sinecaudum TaxID=45286 RepID=A0A125RDV8_9SACH|nr:HBL187Wp [Eremothecium sinecaudum]AMD18715.1 HBL187Wp [Eremothecium sinecaudum]